MLGVMKEKLMSALASPADDEAKIKGAELHRGRTKARLETLQGELDAARQILAELAAQEAERIVEGEIPPTSGKEMQKAQDRVRQLEGALAVAQQKDVDAQSALERARLMAEIGEEERALGFLKYTIGPKVDRFFVELERLVDLELSPALNAARAAGGQGVHQSFLTDLTLGFEMHLLKAAKTLIPRGRAHIVMMGERKYSDLIPDPTSARTRKRG